MMYGINLPLEQGTDADKFEKFYQAIIDKLKAKNIKIILSTPAAIGEKTDFSNPQDGDMNEYSNIIRPDRFKEYFAPGGSEKSIS
jgi:hypothetical protein